MADESGQASADEIRKLETYTGATLAKPDNGLRALADRVTELTMGLVKSTGTRQVDVVLDQAVDAQRDGLKKAVELLEWAQFAAIWASCESSPMPKTGVVISPSKQGRRPETPQEGQKVYPRKLEFLRSLPSKFGAASDIMAVRGVNDRFRYYFRLDLSDQGVTVMIPGVQGAALVFPTPAFDTVVQHGILDLKAQSHVNNLVGYHNLGASDYEAWQAAVEASIELIGSRWAVDSSSGFQMEHIPELRWGIKMDLKKLFGSPSNYTNRLGEFVGMNSGTGIITSTDGLWNKGVGEVSAQVRRAVPDINELCSDSPSYLTPAAVEAVMIFAFGQPEVDKWKFDPTDLDQQREIMPKNLLIDPDTDRPISYWHTSDRIFKIPRKHVEMSPRELKHRLPDESENPSWNADFSTEKAAQLYRWSPKKN